jgi:hypothetical protein
MVALLALAGCASKAPVDYGLQGQTLFLCCSLRFNADHDASDAGYLYQPGMTLPAGTPVQVVAQKARVVTLTPLDGGARYDLYFRYGQKVITDEQYFQEVFLKEDPRPRLARLKPEVAAAVAQNELRVGMSKAEALLARGYPPRHRTASTDADEWLYYDSPRIVSRVKFTNGRISEITQGEAPGS